MRAWAVAIIGSACVITSVCIIVPVIGDVAEEVIIGVVFFIVIIPILGIFVIVTIVVSGIWVLVGRADAWWTTATVERRRSRATRTVVA
jgi:hypothetical protein